jgi:fructose-1,6-bisphosphatase I
MIFDIVKAGGVATTGTKRILDIVPKSIHERSAVYLGSKDDVLDVIKFYEAEAKSG